MEIKQKTLVILSPGFPANEDDTACTPPQQLFVKALKEVSPTLNTIVITFHYPFFAGEYNWHGIKVISIGGKDEGRLLRLATWIKALFILKRLKKAYHLTGILSFWLGECAFVGNYFSKRNNITHYTWLLGQDAKPGNKYFKWIKPKGDTLIALSDFLATEIENNYGVSPGNVIPVGIDNSLFLENPPKRDIDILGAGSLIPLKQYQLFVEAIVSLKKSFPGIKAVICGKGPEMERLQTLARLPGLKNNLSFTGELPHGEVLALMQRSKVFLHTSAYEGYGAVIAEALYAGAHVVSFCKPMHENYKHHHVIKNSDEIEPEISAILNNANIDHSPVLTCTAQQAAKSMINLFD